MYLLIVSDETFPAVEQKYDRVHNESIRSRSGYLSRRVLDVDPLS